MRKIAFNITPIVLKGLQKNSNDFKEMPLPNVGSIPRILPLTSLITLITRLQSS